MLDATVTYPVAFAAGLTSFLSPCILPLVPAYFSFISGYSLEEMTVSMGETMIEQGIVTRS